MSHNQLQPDMPKLVVIAKGKPREIEMGQELTIGRGYSNLLRLEGDEISRVHAIIYRRNEDFILRDLDSKNGVFLNGNKINHAQLGPGDKVQVGKYKMVFNPPLGFDINGFVDSALRLDSKASGNGSPPGVRSGDADFATSRRFKVAVDSAGLGDARMDKDSAPDLRRDEVTILTRHELNRMMSELTGRTAEIAADYQDLFFQALMQSQAKSESFADVILNALVQALSAERAVIIGRNKASGDLNPMAISAPNADVAVNRVVLKSGFAEGKSILCPRTDEAGLFRDNDTIKRDRIASLISIPLGDGEAGGLLYLDRLGETDGFRMAHLVAAARVARLLELHMADKEFIMQGDSAS